MKNQKARNIYGITDAPSSAVDLKNMHLGHISYFNELWESGKENERYRMSDNFSTEQKDDITSQGRIPVAVAATSDKLTRIISSERNSRTRPKARATKPEKEVTAELVNLRFNKVNKDSDIDYTKSEIFESGVAVKYGCGLIEKTFNKRGEEVLRLSSIDYQDVVWDSNSKKYFKNDGAFMARRKNVYRIDIEKDYGKEIADSINFDQGYFGRDIENYFGITDKNGNRDYDIITLFEHYQKVLRETYQVVWDGKVLTKEFSRKEAEELLRILKIPFILSGQRIPKASIVSKNEDACDYYKFAGDIILEYKQTDLEDYPLIIYQSFNFIDKIWCMTDVLKPENKLMDKLLSQIDYAFGHDLKDAWEIVEPWLMQGQSIETIMQRLKSGEPIFTTRPGAIHSVPPKGANPQWLQVFGVLKENIAEYSGGALFSGGDVGKQREAKETVLAKLRQQQLVTTLFIDNLRRWEKEVYRRLLPYLNDEDTEHIIKVEGGNLTPQMLELLKQNNLYTASENYQGAGYVYLNKPGIEMSYLDTADIDIEITDESASDAEKESEYQRMLAYEQGDPDLRLSQTWREKKLQLIDSVNYEDRLKIQQEISEAKQIMQQQEQMRSTIQNKPTIMS
uniref:Portal protein n=1 Tax=viral metagenome TaxID=1070528 RepID=A0A6M3XS90_9ZZZZ